MERPAATASLMVLRHPDDPEVLWVRRRRDARFLGGFRAFPGGALEPGDAGVPVLGATGEEAAARVAALRETFEETGVLAVSGAGPLAPGLRGAVRGGALPFGALLAERGLRVDAGALVSAGAWLAPPYLGLRMRTRFFATWSPAGAGVAPDVPEDDPEHDAAGWVRPADALAAWDRGEVLLAPPTLALLDALARGAAGDPARFFDVPEAREVPARFARIRPHITLFPVRTPTLPPATHTNTYIMGDESLVVVDPASPHAEERAALDAHLDALAAEGRRVQSVLLTHAHHDHVGGATWLARRLDVPILAHPDAAARLPFPVEGLLEDEAVVAAGRYRFRALHTPGHAPGHLCLLDEATGTVAAGDMVAGLGTIVVDPSEGSMATYLASLERLRRLGASCLMPSHGAVTGGSREKLEAYIAHRLEREARVVEALAAGASGIQELLPLVYADVPPATWPLASVSLRAHLIKLAEEGRARRVEGAPEERWVPA